MPIEDVFGIKGRGTVVTGRVERGTIKVGEPVEIIRFGDTRATVATGLEMFHKSLDVSQAGDAVGVLLRGVDRDEVERGQVLVKPGSMRPYTKAKAEGLRPEPRGRRAAYPVLQRLQAPVLHPHQRHHRLHRPARRREMVMPGDNVQMDIELISPVPLESGMRFAIREGGRTVGSGVITEVMD